MDLLGPIFGHKPFVDKSPLIPSCIKYGRRFKLVFGKKTWFCVAIVAERSVPIRKSARVGHWVLARPFDPKTVGFCNFVGVGFAALSKKLAVNL